MDSGYSGGLQFKDIWIHLSPYGQLKITSGFWQNTLTQRNTQQRTIKSKLLGYLYEIWQERLITCIAVSQYYSNTHIASFVLHINRTFWKPDLAVFYVKCSLRAD